MTETLLLPHGVEREEPLVPSLSLSLSPRRTLMLLPPPRRVHLTLTLSSVSVRPSLFHASNLIPRATQKHSSVQESRQPGAAAFNLIFVALRRECFRCYCDDDHHAASGSFVPLLATHSHYNFFFSFETSARFPGVRGELTLRRQRHFYTLRPRASLVHWRPRTR